MNYPSILKKNPYINESRKFDKDLLQVPVSECGEKLISLRAMSNASKIPIFFNEGDNKIFYLRSSVAQALLKAAKHANNYGYIFKIEDAYRSLERQKERFLIRLAEIKKKFNPESNEILFQIANMYTAGIPILAAHTAGAAVDIILLSDELEPVDMGSSYPDSKKEAVTSYKILPDNVIKIRKLLCRIMGSNGFTNYPFEYWHFSIGDVCAASIKKEKFARYGPVSFHIDNLTTVPLSKKKLYTYLV